MARFKVHGRQLTKRELHTKRDERIAIYSAVPVCIGAYYLFGAGWLMIISSMITYGVIRYRLTGRRLRE